jgi:uncharacterized membrane protein YagU involved in acid resistance
MIPLLLWGFAATTILTTMLRGSQAMGLTRIDLPLVLGLFFTADRDKAKVFGFFFHLLNGWLFAFVYWAFFRFLGSAGLWLGALMGAVHGLFVLIVVLPVLPGAHPRMASDASGPEPTRELEPPGFLALNYGRGTPLVSFLSHIVYGAILGLFLPLG